MVLGLSAFEGFFFFFFSFLACFIELCHTKLSGSLVKSAQVGSVNGRLDQLTEFLGLKSKVNQSHSDLDKF